MKTPEEIGQQVRDAFEKTGRFRPCAFFDQRLDCIRVVVRDCSILETRINKYLTLLEDNYEVSGENRYVGFTIKGARHFCQEHGFDLSTPVDISKLLDSIVAIFPEPAVELSVRLVAKPLIKKEKFKKVSLPPLTSQPQSI